MSALPLKADMFSVGMAVRSVPKADVPLRSLLIARRRLVPVIARLALIVSVRKQCAHVPLIEGSFVTQSKVAIEVGKVKADAITLGGNIHPIGVVDAACGRHGRDRLRGDRKRAAFYVLFRAEKTAIPKNIGDAPAL